LTSESRGLPGRQDKMAGYTWQFTFLGIFFLFCAGFAVVPILFAWLIRPKKPSTIKREAYECGLPSVGESWIQFKVQYYLYALVFIVFDVEIILVIPWATVFKALGPVAFVEMAVFLGILFLGLVYVWRKRDLEWY
jgi:NADH:ubiquinone oxidoreductase subunit 3 (subunit A)